MSELNLFVFVLICSIINKADATALTLNGG